MARTKVVNGVRMNLTPEEETARDAEAVSYTHLTLPTILRV